MKERTTKEKGNGDKGLTPMHYKLGLGAFFVYGTKGGVRWVKDGEGGLWRFKAVQFPNFDDLGVYLGVLKALDDARHVQSKALSVEKIQGTEGWSRIERYVLQISKRTLAEYCGITYGKTAWEQMLASIQRTSELSAYQYECFGDQKPEFVRSMRLIHSIRDSHARGRGAAVAIEVDRFFVKGLKNEMLIHYREIQASSGQIVKALLLFCETHKPLKPDLNKRSRWVTERDLIEYLGVKVDEVSNDERRDYRRKIKSALENLRRRQLIDGFELINKASGVVYRIDFNDELDTRIWRQLAREARDECGHRRWAE